LGEGCGEGVGESLDSAAPLLLACSGGGVAVQMQ
jgi:hypothetical protein